MTSAPATHLPELPVVMIEDHVREALREDLGRAGDITSLATIGPEMTAVAEMNAREDGVIAGLPLARAAFAILDRAIKFDSMVKDGEHVAAGQSVARISGSARALLSGERVALNYLMHLSGIATHTARFAERIAHTKARVTCTRKTIPGLRALEKYAVRCGGGSSHRYGLDDAILIKDNHIAVCGGVAEALRAAKAYAGHLVKIEIEVDTLEQFAIVLQEGVDAVLLDNMKPDQLRKAVLMNEGQMNEGRVTLEASGNVDLDTIKAIAETGVDYISTSKITMAAPTLDIGLDIKIG